MVLNLTLLTARHQSPPIATNRPESYTGVPDIIVASKEDNKVRIFKNRHTTCLKQTFYEASGACDTELFHAQTIWPPGNVEADPLGQPTYEPECVAGQQGGILDIDGSGALTGNTDSKTGELITHPVLSTATMCYIDGLGQSAMYYEVYTANDECEGEPFLKGSSDEVHGTLPFGFGSDTCMSGPSAVPFIPLNQVSTWVFIGTWVGTWVERSSVLASPSGMHQ